jgi:hypothetical protein
MPGPNEMAWLVQAGQRNCSLYIGWANLYELPREMTWSRLYANTPGPNEMAWLDKETAAYILVGPTSTNCQERWLGQGYMLIHLDQMRWLGWTKKLQPICWLGQPLGIAKRGDLAKAMSCQGRQLGQGHMLIHLEQMKWLG